MSSHAAGPVRSATPSSKISRRRTCPRGSGSIQPSSGAILTFSAKCSWATLGAPMWLGTAKLGAPEKRHDP